MIDGVQLGPLFIRFYGILLMLGALSGAWLASLQVKRRGKDPDIVWDLLVYLIIGGVIGARLWHVLTPTAPFTRDYYLSHPLDVLMVWKGGLSIYGTILGGLVALWLYARKHHEFSFLQWTDIAVPGLALGQAIGRWGNFFNQELYGLPTTLPWKIYIENPLPAFADQHYFHPLFAYESLLNLVNMGLLLWLGRRFASKLHPGDLLAIYAAFYGLVRFGLDFLRIDKPDPDYNHVFIAVVAVAALAYLVWSRRRSQDAV